MPVDERFSDFSMVLYVAPPVIFLLGVAKLREVNGLTEVSRHMKSHNSIKTSHQSGISSLGFLFMVSIILAMSSAWLTHVVTCFQDDRWGFLIAGALCFPVAIFHGFGLWFGIW